MVFQWRPSTTRRISYAFECLLAEFLHGRVLCFRSRQPWHPHQPEARISVRTYKVRLFQCSSPTTDVRSVPLYLRQMHTFSLLHGPASSTFVLSAQLVPLVSRVLLVKFRLVCRSLTLCRSSLVITPNLLLSCFRLQSSSSSARDSVF